MEHIETTHRYEHEGRIWEISISDGMAKLITRKAPFTWDYEFGFLKAKSTSSFARLAINQSWEKIKDKPQPSIHDENKIVKS